MACIPTPTSSAATNVVTSYVAPLTLYASWDDDRDPTQTYRIMLRDIPARRNYIVTGVNAKEFLFDAAGQAQLVWGTTPLVVVAIRNYALQIMGETDLQTTSATVGYMQDMPGPPSGPVICDVTDETSVSQFYPEGVPPYGCQNEQVSGKVRIFWDRPVDTGYFDGTPVTTLGSVFQWALDSTFTSNVVEETCMDIGEFGTKIKDGEVCTFSWKIAQIPSNGTLYGGPYFIRVAAVVSIGVGPFTEAVSVQMGPEPDGTLCPAGQYQDPVGDNCVGCALGTYKYTQGDYACFGCGDHTYTRETNSTSISDCLCTENSFSTIHGSDTHSEFLSCICYAGYTRVDDAGYTRVDEKCVACAVGTYKDGVGDYGCASCGDNTFTHGTNSTSYTDCMCAENTYIPGIKEQSGKLTCPCNAGSNLVGGNCIACAVGRYKDKVGDYACSLCGDNTYTNGTNSNSFSDCMCAEISYPPSIEDNTPGVLNCICNVGYTQVGGVCTDE